MFRFLGAAVSCLITSSPYFFACHFHSFGFDHILASKPFDLKEVKFFPERVLHPKDKPIQAQNLCQQLGLNFEDSVAFGDSISDVPLFQALTHTVSVNGDAHIKDWAKHHYKGAIC
jgi:phosphoserine phosphatase